MRLQLALDVKDLDAAVDFYSRMFGAAPHKRKPGYANFAIADPPLKLVLFENPLARERINHLGVETFEEEAVEDAAKRFAAAGLPVELERGVACCHARANKVWVREPDGLRWEWYRVLEDIDGAACAPEAQPVSIEAPADAACAPEARPVSIEAPAAAARPSP